MKHEKLYLACSLWLALSGCAALPPSLLSFLPDLSKPEPPSPPIISLVEQNRANYRLIKTHAVGESSGFTLLLFLELVPPSYIDAMADLIRQGGVTEGKALALTNFVQERSTLNFILFGIPQCKVRADIIEFVADQESGRRDEARSLSSRLTRPFLGK